MVNTIFAPQASERQQGQVMCAAGRHIGTAGRGIAPLYERAKSWRGREGETIIAN